LAAASIGLYAGRERRPADALAERGRLSGDEGRCVIGGARHPYLPVSFALAGALDAIPASILFYAIIVSRS